MTRLKIVLAATFVVSLWALYLMSPLHFKHTKPFVTIEVEGEMDCGSPKYVPVANGGSALNYYDCGLPVSYQPIKATANDDSANWFSNVMIFPQPTNGKLPTPEEIMDFAKRYISEQQTTAPKGKVASTKPVPIPKDILALIVHADQLRADYDKARKGTDERDIKNISDELESTNRLIEKWKADNKVPTQWKPDAQHKNFVAP